jgi:hypothetical protein
MTPDTSLIPKERTVASTVLGFSDFRPGQGGGWLIAALAGIHGVGAVKRQKYGSAFLSRIRKRPHA